MQYFSTISGVMWAMQLCIVYVNNYFYYFCWIVRYVAMYDDKNYFYCFCCNVAIKYGSTISIISSVMGAMQLGPLCHIQSKKTLHIS